MTEKPKLGGMYKDRDFRDQLPGFFPVIQLSSDGRDFNVDVAEWLIDYFTPEVVERMQYILTDAIYRVRPDLRKQ